MRRRSQPAQGFPHVWLCGYEPRDVRVRSVSGGASVLITGTCLATEARDSIRHCGRPALGGWDAPGRLPGLVRNLTVLAVDSETIRLRRSRRGGGAVLVYYTGPRRGACRVATAF